MTDEPFQIKSFLPHNIIQFITIIILSLLAFTIGWERLGIAYADPFGWILSVTIICIITSLTLLAISWYMKKQFELEDVEWNTKEQEVSFDEYNLMYSDYITGYSHLISRFDERDFFSLVISLVSLYLVPYIMALYLITIQFSPYIFGIITIGYGLLLSRFSFKYFGSSKISLGLVPPTKLRSYVSISQNVDGVAFAGIHLSIAEAGGYYDIIEVRPTIRLEGIESAIRIDFVLDDFLILKSLKSVFLISEDILEHSISEDDDLVESIRVLMRMTYEKYIELKGKDTILDDLLQELGIELG